MRERNQSSLLLLSQRQDSDGEKEKDEEEEKQSLLIMNHHHLRQQQQQQQESTTNHHHHHHHHHGQQQQQQQQQQQRRKSEVMAIETAEEIQHHHHHQQQQYNVPCSSDNMNRLEYGTMKPTKITVSTTFEQQQQQHNKREKRGEKPPQHDSINRFNKFNNDGNNINDNNNQQKKNDFHFHFHHHRHHHYDVLIKNGINNFIKQIPAILLVVMLNFMIGIPFGAAYFPVGWTSSSLSSSSSDINDSDSGDAEDTNDDDENNNDDDNIIIHGNFPLVNSSKEILGLRMFLFSTIIGQLTFTYTSKFNNGIACQMVENVPFYLEICHIVISSIQPGQGYDGLDDTLSTIFFIYGISSICVGIVFYLLGILKLGNIIYFFPSHVLVGCIGGIGCFIIITSIEVTTNTTFNILTLNILQELYILFINNIHLISPVILLECTLRLLMYYCPNDPKTGKTKYPLLGPIYYCLITPMFYFILFIFNIDKSTAQDAGYFFPTLDDNNNNNDNNHTDDIGTADTTTTTTTATTSSQSYFFFDDNSSLFDMFHIINLSTISWIAVIKCIPTIVSLVCFSLIHVPINIPAFAISSNVDVDMNNELISHGYSNTLSGILFGGLQNYMTYSNSVIDDRAHGYGKVSSLCIVILTCCIYVVGPTIASYVPRCMAGTLLIHIGIDLFIEGIYDSYGNYDSLEYAGIWLITITMVVFGMSAALIAGVITALTTYLFQSIKYINPIKASCTASRLRGSIINRSLEANEILNSNITGRNKIFIIQLQGHIFFGNVVPMTDTIKDLLEEKKEETEEEKKKTITTNTTNTTNSNNKPLIIIIDCTLVLGMDSSAAQNIAKLKRTMHKQYNINLTIFVTGSSDGFPCEYHLSECLQKEEEEEQEQDNNNKWNDDDDEPNVNNGGGGGWNSSRDTNNNIRRRQSSNHYYNVVYNNCPEDGTRSPTLRPGSDVSLGELLLTEGGGGNTTTISSGGVGGGINNKEGLFQTPRNSIYSTETNHRVSLKQVMLSSAPEFPSNRVCNTLDEALIFAEDVLIALVNPSYLDDGIDETSLSRKVIIEERQQRQSSSSLSSIDDEKDLAMQYLTNLCPGISNDDLCVLFDLFEREVYNKDTILWNYGDYSNCTKLLVVGNLISLMGDTDNTTEMVYPGNLIGEVGLVNNMSRLTTVQCTSDEVILYSLSRNKWETLLRDNVRVATYIHMIVIRYLSHRVQHVSNRLIECRSLPI